MSVQSKIVTCYVALGSNLGDSLSYLNTAVAALRVEPNISNLEVSHFYKSKPHGPKDQPDYLNGAVKFRTSFDAIALLDLLQNIENKNQRKREGVIRWGARTLDLDLLFYDNNIIQTKRLTIPHPRICERAFVLLPLRDLEANLKVNERDTINNCIDRLSKADLNDCIVLDEEELNG